MLRIAYCDDMQQDRDAIMTALTQIEVRWKEEFKTFSFTSGEKLCESMKEFHYDVILLDIQMKGIDGIETATRIRNLREGEVMMQKEKKGKETRKKIKEEIETKRVCFSLV